MIDLLFQLLNFGLFVAGCWYIYKNFMVDSIRESISEEQKEEIRLHKHSESLENAVHTVRHEIGQQERKYRNLHDTFVQWRTKHEQERVRVDQEYRARRALLEQQWREQEKRAEMLAILRKFRKKGFDHARSRLYEQYHDTDKGRNFVHAIVKQVSSDD